MLKLSQDLSILSIRPRWGNSVSMYEYIYVFKYKEIFLELEVQLSKLGYSNEDKVLIINFGYSLNFYKENCKELNFELISNYGEDDGRATKEHLDGKEAREIVRRFIKKRLELYLKNIFPAIVVRGPLNDKKASLPRYQELDEAFWEYGYKKRVFALNELGNVQECHHLIREGDRYF